jgi:hypothetical protein
MNRFPPEVVQGIKIDCRPGDRWCDSLVRETGELEHYECERVNRWIKPAVRSGGFVSGEGDRDNFSG